MSHFGFTAEALDELGANWTATEIAQQPRMWESVSRSVQRSHNIGRLLEEKNLRILLTGAGSSAFIGECLAPAVMRLTGRRVDAVPTTDLVSGPRRCFQRDVPTLMVSFARSGSSPESVAALDLADEFVDNCHHLILTCNKDGDLCQQARSRQRSEVITLPSQTHDRSFAMTSSFTSLLLAAGRIFGIMDDSLFSRTARQLGAEDVLSRALGLVHELVDQGFERVVYLGSNELKGLAREAALKLLELTDGQVVASFDSPLGFRHGPKTMVNGETLVVLFLSNDAHTRRYDLDLLRELRSDGNAGRVLAISARPGDDDVGSGDFIVRGLARSPDIEAALPFAIFAQLLALFHSLKLGLTPDNPSVSGAVSRVVRGVTIYAYPS